MLKNWICILLIGLNLLGKAQKEDSILIIPSFITPDGEFDDDKASAIENRIQYSALVDLTKDYKNQISILLYTPKVKVDTITFGFDLKEPNTNLISFVEPYINNLKVFSINGKELPLLRNDSNTWTIANAKQLGYIIYMVKDSSINNASLNYYSLNSFQFNEKYLLNLYSIFGYIEGVKNIIYEISITKPDFLDATSAVLPKKNIAQIDKFTFPNYSKLASNTITYSILKK